MDTIKNWILENQGPELDNVIYITLAAAFSAVFLAGSIVTIITTH